MKAPTTLFATVLLLAPLSSAAESKDGSGEDRPNILLLLADDLRPDFLSALGYPAIETPHLDRLAGRGTTFTRANCSYPICVVSRAEMFTGTHGWENGLAGMKVPEPRENLVWWAECFRDAGYDTWHVGKWHVRGKPSEKGYTASAGLFGSGGGRFWKEGQVDWKGFPITGYRGWVFQQESPRQLFPEMGVGVTPEISETFVDAFLEQLEGHDGSPWLCHLSFTAPHDPLFLPPGWEGKYGIEDFPLPENWLPVHPFDHGNFDGRDEALLPWPRTETDVKDLLRVYVSVVEHMDREIGRLLDRLEERDELDRTLVIFSSDNGMACGSHGLRGKQNQYEHSFGVPLVIAGPGVPEDRRTSAEVYLRELYPTTCDLAGIEIPDSVTAASFAPVLEGSSDSHHEHVFGYFTDTQRMIRSASGWKLIRYPQIDRWQLFDLRSDPHEVNDLSESADEKVLEIRADLEQRLLAWRREQGDPLLDQP